MAKKLFFGEYLIQKKLVTEEDIMDALTYQDKKMVPIETVAIKLGFLNMKEVFKIFTMQAGTEESFLHIAQKKKFLTEEQVQQVIEKRKNMVPPLGQVLVELKKISDSAMKAELNEFLEIVNKFKSIRDRLMQMPVFSRIAEAAADHLAYIPELRRYKENEAVISEGEDADSVYCVVSGTLKVTANNPDGGKEVFITLLEENDIFGEAAIFANEKRTANVIAIGDVELFEFSKLDFLEFLRKFPTSSLPILVFIIQRLLYKLNCTNKELAFERRKFVGQDEVNSLLESLFD